ncbi:TPA: GNAT family N-acetyltransferase [Campylobacter coli]|nr:GNAT family N-acetyltransferase [Campylobacter coli]OOX97391.1 GNAT family N-acetyltransferase [Campylobacter coli]OOY02451.1 GNAT family N-acetyltransferase [Campylobacter coli]HEB9344649.1 GNAT family N-acetyltransferase [Campylobacter coli]HEB9431691.1 GNAT family N-acetyltransferase [Campylobacter coli]
MLETKRLILRKFETNDTKALFEILSDKIVNHFLPWYVFESLEQTKVHLKDFYLQTNQNKDFYRYAICLKEDNKPIGYLHFHNNHDNNDFGYAIKKEFWNQGLISEAAKKLIEKLKEDKIPYITATHDVKNIASGKVMHKLNMCYQYSYEELWQPKNIKVIFRLYQLNLDENKERVYRGYLEKYPHFIEQF